MSDFGDDALTRQEQHLKRALAEMGIAPRETPIPPPHYDADPEPAFCRVCGAHINGDTRQGRAGGGKPEIGALCGPCGRQLDKGGR